MYLTHEPDVSNLENDKFHLTNNHEFFPELVWEQILRKIKDPVDIESCSNASTYFWKFFKLKRQTEVVLPRVLQHLHLFFKEYETSGNGNESKSTYDGSDSEDNESGTENWNISMTDFWRLRHICKISNTTIKNLCQSPQAGHFRMKDDTETFENEHLLTFADDLFYPEALSQQFVHHFDTTHYDLIGEKPKNNPFLGRSVQFKCIYPGHPVDDEEDQFYIDGIFEILRKYGEEIWYVELDFVDMNGTNLVEIYGCFVAFLKLMPNLKVLRLNCERQNSDEEWNLEWGIYDERRTVLRQLRNQIIENPIPKLTHLEYVSTTDVPSTIFNELLQRNRHINKLQVDRQRRHSRYAMFELCLPNLNALGVTFCSISDFEEFEKCNISLQLQKFYFWYNGPADILSWSRLFRALGRQLGEHCTELLVEMPLHKTEYQSIQTFNETHSGRLSLPNLQQIRIRCDSAISLDFLLPAQNSLRAISIRFSDEHCDGFLLKRFADYEQQQFVKFIGFNDRMEDSNIWDELTMLQKLTLFRKMEMGGCVRYIRGSSLEGDCVLEKRSWYRETI